MIRAVNSVEEPSMAVFSRPILLSLALSIASVASPIYGSAAFAAEKAQPEGAKQAQGATYQRLSTQVVPERYDLFFEPNFDQQDFEGTETVFINLKEKTSQIVLNSVDLSVYEAQVAKNDKGHGDWVKAEIDRNKDKEIVTFKFAKPLSPGRYELSLKFSGKLSDKLCGFYLSTFKDKEGKEHKMASTQMEPTDARRMFPCFDEPIYKATYRVTAAIPTNMSAISNAAVQFEKVDQRKDKKIVTFEESPKMSSYLFALVVGELTPSQPVQVNGKTIRIWTTAGKEHLTAFALASAGKFMAYYEDYFGVPYPLKKLDLIGVPDFAHGAMENIGAITFRETALLVDEANSSTPSKMRVADVVAHEMAHLWFGDLVTMAWWNDLWLNEAFATWMSDKAVDKLKPEWRLWDDFALARNGALGSDSLLATRAVQGVVNSPNDALEMFDEITYEKGASIMRMLEKYISEETFQSGIQSYMKKHSFANATTEDLWQSLSEATTKKGSGKGVDVSALMQAWVHSPGYPLVTFKSDEKGGLTFNQERYLLSNQNQASGKPVAWQVPLVLKSGKSESESQRLLLEKTSDKMPAAKDSTLFINGQGNGFFRTKYDGAQLAALQEKLKADPEFLNPAERMSLISDLWSLAYSGRISIDTYLGFTDTVAGDRDPYVQGMLVSQLGNLDSLISEETRPGFEALVRKRLTPVLDNLTMAKRGGDSDLVNTLRGHVVGALGTIGNDPKIIEFCRGQFPTYLKDPKSLDGNMLSAIVSTVAYNGDQATFDQIKAAFIGATDPQSQQRNLGALAEFRDKAIIGQALDLSLSKDVKSQDITQLAGDLLGSSTAKQQAWTFVKAHWGDYESRLSSDMMPRLIGALGHFSTREERADIAAFVEAHPLPAGRRKVAKTLEIIAIRGQFEEKQSNSLTAFLKKMVVANLAH
jgi:puromycin-sensitive aminopeptidase